MIPLKATTDKALAGGCPTIEKVIVYRRTGFKVPMQEGRDLWWHDVVSRTTARLRAGIRQR